MKRAELVFRAALVVCLIAWAVQASPRRQSAQTQPNLLEESDIDRLEKELADPITRLSAIAALADFGARKLYQVGSVFIIDGDAKRGALRERAANLARVYADIDTVSLALDSDDPRLQMWGLWFWNAGIGKAVQSAGRIPSVLPKEGLTDEENDWHALTLKVRRLAKDSAHRSVAIEILANFSRS